MTNRRLFPRPMPVTDHQPGAPRGARASEPPDEKGQATVEAALTLPVVLIALLLVVQVGIVVRDALALTQAAREGARAAAISADDHSAAEAVRAAAGPLDADRIDIAIDPPSQDRRRGQPITVDLDYVRHLEIPIVSRLVTLDLPLRASASMLLERDGG